MGKHMEEEFIFSQMDHTIRECLETTRLNLMVAITPKTWSIKENSKTINFRAMEQKKDPATYILELFPKESNLKESFNGHKVKAPMSTMVLLIKKVVLMEMVT